MPIQQNVLAFGNAPTKPRTARLTPEQEESTLAMLARQAGGFIDTLGLALDTPAAIGRGLLANDPSAGFNWDSDRRVSGEELLDQYGILKPTDNKYLRTAAGLAAEIALDPLAVVSGPMRALSTAGKAAKATGILDKASDAALAATTLTDASKTLTGRSAMKWAERLAPMNTAVTPETFSIRPLIGPRAARASTTLDELVKYVDGQAGNNEAFEQVSKYLAGKGKRYEDVAGEKLGGAFGVGYFTPFATFTPPGSGKVLDALDAVGQAAEWSYLSRLGSAMFNKRVGDTIDAADQVEALKHSRRLDDAAKEGRRLAARHAMTVSEIKLSPEAQRVLGANTLLSPEGNDFLTRMFENTYTRSDQQLKSLIGPKLDDAIASWDAIRKDNIRQGQLLGLDILPYSDEYHVRYSPRTAAEADFGEYGSGLGRSALNTRMLEQRARQQYLATPGGTVDLRELSLLPKVDEFARNGDKSRYSIDEVGQEIADYLNAKHAPGAATSRVDMPPTTYKIGKEKGAEIASFLQRLDKRRPDGVAMFSEHPVSAQARTIVSQHLARANAKYIYDSIAESAIATPRGQLAGNFKSVRSAMQDVARATGLKMDEGQASPIAFTNLANAIAKRFGTNVSELNLDNFSIPESVYNRLVRIQSFYSTPRAQQEIGQFFDKFSQLFKGFVLAWPSRFVRDMYSNAFSIWLENGSVMDTLYGLDVARSIVRGNFDNALARIKQLPQYAGINDAATLKQRFIEDAAASGILQTLASNDLLTANRSGALNQLVPGTTPMFRSDGLRELAGGSWNRFFEIKDIRFPWQKQSAYETANPILNASQKISDFTDTVARLGGYISLLKQGVTSDVAAKRITEALVDYSSLTTMERNFFRTVFPWWAYNSRIGKYVVQHLASNPGGSYAQTIRALNTIQASDEETYVPQALRQQFAIRVPDAAKAYLGIHPETDTETFFKDIDLPGVDVLSLLAPNPTWGGAVMETGFNVLNQASPLIRGPLELFTQRDFFSDRPIDEAVTPLDRIYKRLTGSQTSMPAVPRTLINMIPGLQRPISLAGGLMDDRLGVPQRLLKQGINTLSGVKLQDVDPEWKWNDARRAAAQNLRGYTRTFTTSTVPNDLIPSLPPDKQVVAVFDKVAAKRVRDIQEQKRKRREQLMRGVEE